MWVTKLTASELKASKLLITHGASLLNWKLGAGDGSHPTNPVRAQLATDKLVDRLGDAVQVIDPTVENQSEASAEVRAALESIHAPRYVASVIDEHVSGQWLGVRPELAQAAVDMFAGTMVAVRAIVNGETKVAFNPMGAKHHAAFDHSSGFNVFNDMAWAALEFQRAGLKPLYLDWDIHAGDGVYELLKGTGVPRISIHCGSIFPGNREMQSRSIGEAASDVADRSLASCYTVHNEADHAYNFNIGATDGDEALAWAISGAEAIIENYQPDVILLAAGADGHEGSNNLGVENNYTYDGFEAAAEMVARQADQHSAGRVLIGGAGGYQPLDHTPEIWARVVERIYRAGATGE